MPVPVDLTKPGRKYVLEACANCRVYAHPSGCLEIERVSDGASAFFQGDDADSLRADLRPCYRQRDLDAALARVLSQYDDVLTLPAAQGA